MEEGCSRSIGVQDTALWLKERDGISPDRQTEASLDRRCVDELIRYAACVQCLPAPGNPADIQRADKAENLLAARVLQLPPLDKRALSQTNELLVGIRELENASIPVARPETMPDGELLEQADAPAPAGDSPRRSQTGNAGADDDHICFAAFATGAHRLGLIARPSRPHGRPRRRQQSASRLEIRACRLNA